jgi:hypothetical protein
MKDMDQVKRYHAHNNLLEEMSKNKCHGCIKLKEHKSMMKDQKVHKDELDQLKYQMSDEALQQMPQFQGRVRLYIFFLVRGWIRNKVSSLSNHVYYFWHNKIQRDWETQIL